MIVPPTAGGFARQRRPRLGARLDKTVIEGEHDHGRPVAQVQLVEDMRNVALDRRFTDDELLPDFLIAGSSPDQAQHFQLASGQVAKPATRFGRVGGRRACPIRCEYATSDGRVEPGTSRRNHAGGADDVSRWSVLEDESGS